jgi:hypothetical protein
MFALWTKRAIVHALVFVRLAHDRRFVGAVLVLFVLVRFVFIRISGGIVLPVIMLLLERGP